MFFFNIEKDKQDHNIRCHRIIPENCGRGQAVNIKWY